MTARATIQVNLTASFVEILASEIKRLSTGEASISIAVQPPGKTKLATGNNFFILFPVLLLWSARH